MNKAVLVLIFIAPGLLLTAQSRKALEEQRKKTLEEIIYVDNLIKETEKKKSLTLGDLRILNNKLQLQENVIKGLKLEAEMLQEKIEISNLAIKLMEDDLIKLKSDYANAIINSYRISKGHPWMVYIFSAKDFNQGYKRIKYLQQVSRFRRNEAEIILQLRDEAEKTKNRLKEDLDQLYVVRKNEETQKKILESEHERKRRMVNSLSGREKQLRQELENKKRIARQIENEIIKLIEEERKRAAGSEMTPELELVSTNFAENKGKLPWPVQKGVITGSFGLQKHKELAFVTENNPGIEITSFGKTMARTVFGGVVAKVLAINGANMTVIVRHGNYYTVYQNLVNVIVKAGDNVKVQEEIGEVYYDVEKGNKAIMKFMIFRDKEKLNPEEWIIKRGEK